jgi:dienelactone hydrolase
MAARIRRRAPLALAAAVLTLAALTGGTASAGADPGAGEGVSDQDVTIESADRTFGGTVYLPEDHSADLPGLVLVAGSGEGLSREVYQPVAEAFARAGIATLVYDKRGPEEGYSMFQASFADLADDAVAGVRLLRDHPDVDPDRVGVHGHSEGGWTVLEAADRSTDVDFVVAAAPSALSPERTQVWMNETQLRHTGVAPHLAEALGGSLTRQVVALDSFRLHGHDPVPALTRLDRPFLGVFAEFDRSAPPGETLEIYHETLERADHPHYELRVIRGASHGMEPHEDGFVEADAELDRLFGDLDPDYVATVSTWVNGLDETFLEQNTYGLSAVADGYRSAEAVWQALREPEQIRRWHGWDYDGLDGEIKAIYLDDIVVSDADYTLDTGAGQFALEPRGDRTIVRITRPAPAGKASWDGIYDEVNEGWVTFVHQLRYYLERHPGQERRTITVDKPVSLPEGGQWFRTEHQRAVLIDDYGLVTTPHGTTVVSAYGLDDAGFARLAATIAGEAVPQLPR